VYILAVKNRVKDLIIFIIYMEKRNE